MDAPSDDFIQHLTSHQTQLRGLIYAALGNYADTQDVLQRTNLVLWKKATEFDADRSFLAWAIGIARFEVLAFVRDQRRERLLFMPELAESLIVQAEELVAEVPARQAALRECLATLPESHRQVLVRKYVKGETLQQLAPAVGRSVDGVKSFLLRVRKALSDCIERRIRLGTSHD
ncbi:MAG: RNA polymerase subunit sigma-70 [Planctomycetaceae bacterium]|nr:RNA polymerase subunit sigma-70 [Planctomycetaceae bacterium]